MDTPFRPGVVISDFPPVTQLLSRKSAKSYNILVGNDAAQVRFAEMVLGLPCQQVETIDDATLLTGQPCLLNITIPKVADLSASVREKASFWSIGPMGRGSAGAMAIVRYALTLLNLERPERDIIQRTADVLATDGIEDIRIAIWKAVWLLLGPAPEPYKRWPEPWEHRTEWLPPNLDPGYRLNTLYRDLTAYAFVLSQEDDAIKKAGLSVSPSKLKYLKTLKLDPERVYNTITEISLWRSRRTDPVVCAFRVAVLW